MATTYVNSENIWVFPCANRTKNLESKLNTEFNFTHIPALAGNKNYVCSEDTDNLTYNFVVGGYYFRVLKDSFPDDNNLYAIIALYKKSLFENSNNIQADTWVLTKAEREPHTPPTSLDDGEGNFIGLIFADQKPNWGLDTINKPYIQISGTSNYYNYYFQYLQLKADGEWLNVNPISSTEIQKDAIITDKIADSSITTAKIANNSVTTAKIADGNITTDKIADSNVTTDKIADSNITTIKIADNAITTAKILANNVTTAKIAYGAITTNQIADENVVHDKLKPTSTDEGTEGTGGAVDWDVINYEAIRTPHIKDNNITHAKLATIEHEAGAAIDSNNIRTNAITGDKILEGSITTAKIADSNITTDKIADSAVTAKKLNNIISNPANSTTANGITVTLAQTNDGKIYTQVSCDAEGVDQAQQVKENLIFTDGANDTTYNGSEETTVNYSTVGAAPVEHNHGILQADGTIKSGSNLQKNKAIYTNNSGELVASSFASEYTGNQYTFINKVQQYSTGSITATTAELPHNQLSLIDTQDNNVELIDNWENKNNIITFKVTNKTIVDKHNEPEILLRKIESEDETEDQYELTFDGLIGAGLNIKATEADCTMIGDCYIETDASSANYGKILVLKQISSTTPPTKTFEAGGRVRGVDGYGVIDITKTSTVANVDNYTITCARDDETGTPKEFTFSVTNGESGIAICNTAASEATKTATLPGFRFSSSSGLNPVTRDVDRQIVVYIRNTNSGATNLKLKINDLNELDIKINGIATTTGNTFYLSQGLYTATIIKESSIYYWNLAPINTTRLYDTVGRTTLNSSLRLINCTLIGAKQTDNSNYLIKLDQAVNATSYTWSLVLNNDITTSGVARLDRQTSGYQLNSGYYLITTKVENATKYWDFEPINLVHSVISGQDASGSNITSNASDTVMTLGDSGVTADTYGPTANATLTSGNTFTVPEIRVNNKGIVISATNHTLTLPSSEAAVGLCLTESGTANKVVTQPYYKKKVGYDLITFANINTTKNKLTLSIQGETAGNIYLNGNITSASNYSLPAGTYLVYCDGTNYYLDTSGERHLYESLIVEKAATFKNKITANNIETTNLKANGTVTLSNTSLSVNSVSTQTLTVRDNIITNSLVSNDNLTVKGRLQIRSGLGGTTSNGIYFSDGDYTCITEKTLDWEDVDDELRISARKEVHLVARDQVNFAHYISAHEADAGAYVAVGTGCYYGKGYLYNSDSRLKTDIIDFAPSTNKSILDLPVKQFKFKNGSDKTYIGCLAQDLQQICPEVVEEDAKGYLAIQESKIVYLLLNEVKTLKQELTEIKEQLTIRKKKRQNISSEQTAIEVSE